MFLISGLSVPIFFLLQESGRLQGEERANEGRIRRKGGGRKTTVSKDPSLKEELERLAVTVMQQAGQSHLILGTGSARRTITNQLTKLCCILALYKALENLDAIALMQQGNFFTVV